MDNFNPKKWFEDTPKEWSIQRMKNIMSVKDDRSVSGEEQLLSVTIHNGVIKRSEYLDDDEGGSRADSLIGYKIVNKNDLVNNIMKMSFRCLGVSPYDGIVSPAYSVFTIDSTKVQPIFLDYLLRINRYVFEYRKLSKGIQESRMRLYDDYFLAIDVIIPPVREQKLIIDYLDKKTHQIDLLVKKIQKKKLIVEEAIRNHFYELSIKKTKLKVIENSWFNVLPYDWEIIKFRQLFEPISIKNSSTERLLSVTQDRGVVFRDEQERDVMNPAGDLSNYKLVQPGDVIISLRSADGGLETSDIKGLVSPAYIVLRPKMKIDRNFYRLLLKSENFIREINRYIKGIRDGKNIYFDDIRDVSIPFLNLKYWDERQYSIESYHSKLVKSFTKFDLKIKLLNEYRESLISSVVTGKIRITVDML